MVFCKKKVMSEYRAANGKNTFFQLTQYKWYCFIVKEAKDNQLHDSHRQKCDEKKLLC